MNKAPERIGREQKHEECTIIEVGKAGPAHQRGIEDPVNGLFLARSPHQQGNCQRNHENVGQGEMTLQAFDLGREKYNSSSP